MGGGKKTSVVGYWYSLGVHMGICRGPVDEIVEATVGDRTVWQGSVTSNHDWTLSHPYLFGGEESEGGIVGVLSARFGEANQTITTAGSDWDIRRTLNPNDPNAAIPGFRGILSMFFNGKIGTNPYPKAWRFRVRRILKGWEGTVFASAYARVLLSRPATAADGTRNTMIYAMNPAHIIFECMTNRSWGRGLDPNMINLPGFSATAIKLYTEGFGLCIKWMRRDTIESFVQTVLDHIGGVLYTDRTTGLLNLDLIRGDYVPEDLPLYDAENGLLEITASDLGSDADLVNEVQVSYIDPVSGETRAVRVDNLGNKQASMGAHKSVSKNFLGLPTESLALRVAQRELKSLGTTLRRFTVVLDRRAWSIRPGHVIRISDPTREIPVTVVRVGKVEYGTLTDGKIKVTAVQDVFGLPAQSYAGTEPPSWAPINLNPCVGRHRVFEMPYGMVASLLTAADLDYFIPQSGMVAGLMEQGRPLNAGIRMMVKDGLPVANENPPNNDNICGV